MKFEPEDLDFELSPYTGLTRKSWIEAGKHLLAGIFQHVKTFDDPLVMPRQETAITYPHQSLTGAWRTIEEKAEIFEGLTRSLFIAAPLIKEDPDLTVCGYRMADYYKSHILRACTPGDSQSVGTYDEILELAGSTDRTRTFQQTVETCALVIGLDICRDVIWNSYAQAEKDLIAGFLLSYAHSGTVPQNWRFFNMLDMAFLHMNGYAIDKEIMTEHASAVINYYAGDGWYRDGQSFDYYSCWAFNVYGPLWNLWYGYENAPDIAARIEEHSKKLMETYPDFFDEDGWTNMWGRSNVYRFAATSPFGAYALLQGRHTLDENDTAEDKTVAEGKSLFGSRNADGQTIQTGIPDDTRRYGLYRRICSGSLLQFLTRDDFYYKGFPTMGFYGMFSPLVQGYSCAESPFWLGKAFLCLDLPAGHPFWTEKENNGTWEKLDENEVKVTALDGPALSFSNHKANRSTILRTGKIVKKTGDIHGMWNYSKLAYHSKYPWEATPEPVASELSEKTVCAVSDTSEKKISAASELSKKTVCAVSDILEKEVTSVKRLTAAEKETYSDHTESMQYVLTDLTDMHTERCNATFWVGEKDGILYRRQFFNYSLDRETHWMQAIDLADFTVPSGILRVDRLRLFRWPVALTLGAFGFPDNGTEMFEIAENTARAVILRGTDSQGRKKQLAMTVYDGWDELLTVRSEHTNPDSLRSVIVYAKTTRNKQYGGAEPHILISQVITRESHEDFTTEELFPIKQITYSDALNSGAYGAVRIEMKDGTVRVTDFDGTEGKMSL